MNLQQQILNALAMLGIDLNYWSNRKINSQVDADKLQEDIKKIAKDKFKKQAVIQHPDKGGDEEQYKILSNAYNLIMQHFKLRYQPPIQQHQVIIVQFNSGGFTGSTTTSNNFYSDATMGF